MPFFFLLLLCCASLSAEPLFSAGRWQGAVVLPASPEPEEWYAAQSLRDYAAAVTGVRPQLVSEKPGTEPPAAGLFVGRTATFQTLAEPLPEVEGDLAVRRVRGQRVFLIGNSPTATRTAVGRFCEQQLGVVFAFPSLRGADYAPLTEVGPATEDLFRPAFAWRAISGAYEPSSLEWAAHVGYGRGVSFSHGLYAAFNAKAYAEDPTLFPTVDGVRRPPTGSGYDPNPNLAHPRAPEIGARFARDWFHANTGAFSVPLGINDTIEHDDGVPSEGWFRNRPVRTDYVVSFLNQVAASFWQPEGDLEGRRHALGTLAYLQAQAAPKQRVHPAVFPWVCADRLGYADPAFAAMESANLRAWVRSGARRVGAYDYLYGADYAAPRVHFAAQAASIRAAADAGVVGWYAELYPIWGFDAPKAWLAAKLLEQPTQDPAPLLDRWFAAAYGPGAAPLREAYAVLGQAWTRDAQAGGTDQWLRHFRSERSAAVLADAEVARIDALLADARRALAAASTTPRVAAQRWRFGQFDEAWALVARFREVYAARRARPADAAAALTALDRLTRAESAFRAAQDQFNVRWGTYGQPVRWADFVPTNPRPAWITLARPAAEEGLRAWARRDPLGEWETKLTARPAQLAEHRVLRWDFAQPASPADAKVVLSPSAYTAERRSGGALRLVAPEGKVALRQTLPVEPGSVVRLAALFAAEPGQHPEARARVTLRFPDSATFTGWSAFGAEGQASLTLVAPADARKLDFEVNFENEMALRSVELHVVPPAARASFP